MTNSSKHPEFFYFRTEFDKTLKTYFKERIDLSVLPPNFSLNIPVLSCLILLVERENEIKDFPKSPPDRYTKDSFVDDIESVGIGVDRVVFDTIEELFTLGFIVEVDSEIKPSDTAYKIVDFINSIFPEMQGINFIAYIVQTIEEVYSDRKSLAEGKEVFYQTLKLRGKKKSSESAKAFQFFQTPLSEKKAVSSKALKERLSQLRKSRNSEEKAVFKKVQVKSVFGSFNKEEVQKEEVQKEEVQKEEVQKEEVQKEEVQKEEVQKEEVQKE
ncbi:MAG: hypothetical protein RBR53_11135, partial [Desulforegulaceae bacterium]|nr:hypothetical protein [Desulforegulaceae bacterium]